MGPANAEAGVTPPAPARRPARRRWWFLVLFLCVMVVSLTAFPLLRRAVYLFFAWLPALPCLVVSAPRQMVGAMERSGPVFIKLAQWMSTRRDIISKEYCDAMGKLHENVPASLTQRDLQRAFGEIPGLQMDKDPKKCLLGGGCVAQVYIATFEGKPVAVKIRRAGIEKQLDIDLRLLRSVASFVTWMRPQLKWMALTEAVDNFGYYMKQQVNLTIEAENMKRFAKNFERQEQIVVPPVYAYTESVLVMGIAEGQSLSDFIKSTDKTADRELRDRVHHLLVDDMMARMLMVHNFVHGDLHPGNLFIKVTDGKPTVTLIDCGISIEISDSMGRLIKEALKPVFLKDAEGLGKAIVRFHEKEGYADMGKDLPGLSSDLGNLLICGCWMVGEDMWSKRFTTFEDYKDTQVSQYFSMMLEDLTKHQVRISPDLWSLMTAVALIEGSILELGFGVNVLAAARKYLFNNWNPFHIVGRIRSSRTLKESDENSKKAGRK